MWNNTEIPLAYLITFRCYGTWLHGDERGSIDRTHNKYKSAYASPNRRRYQHNEGKLKCDAVLLNSGRRNSVDHAVRETCGVRSWVLHALSVRTNHVHVVVSMGDKKPEFALNAFKANATRQMRKDGTWCRQESPWVDKGSKRYLWTERSFQRAIDYVMNGQGGELPDFD
jgi:REP element-mobilizing transposase RayT